MAFYCATMLVDGAGAGAHDDPAYEDIASKFFEHFVAIADAMNTLGGTGLWDEEDGFYYDQLQVDGDAHAAARSARWSGIIPLFAVEVLEQDVHRPAAGLPQADGVVPRASPGPGAAHRLLRARTTRRGSTTHAVTGCWRSRRASGWSACCATCSTRTSSSRRTASGRCRSFTASSPFVLRAGGQEHRVEYVPGESNTGLFGGNSNWRGPIWFPVNYLLIEALERYHHFYGDELRVECPTGSGQLMNLREGRAGTGRAG